MRLVIVGITLVMVGLLGLALSIRQTLGVEASPPAQRPPGPIAHAGPDQTVTGPSPVMVHFDSGVNAPGYSCRWYNQWNNLRSKQCSDNVLVNFGHNNPQPGATRRFNLVVTDDQGNQGSDSVTYTLGQPASSGDPLVGRGFNGHHTIYEFWGCGDSGAQGMLTGFLDDGRWYLSSSAGGESCGLTGFHAMAVCLQGERWEFSDPGGLVVSEGCVGDGTGIGEIEVLVSGDGGWVISDRNTFQKLATLTPMNEGDWAFKHRAVMTR